MDTLSAYARALASRGQPHMTFDWEKAAALIAERQPDYASAGLAGDWENTGGLIYRAGQPVLDDYTYLSSTWATPELDMDGDVVECWRYENETPGWDQHTKWPDVAIAALRAATTRRTEPPAAGREGL